MSENLIIRQMQQPDVAAARAIYQLAFGTHLGIENPQNYRADNAMVETRWQRDPKATLVAELNGKIVGSNLITLWGSVGFFGPLTISPKAWGHGIAGKLLVQTMQMFEDRGTKHLGLYTFANSPKHLELYRKYGFWPRFLTAIMAKKVTPVEPANFSRFSTLSAADQAATLKQCQQISTEIFDGLDLSDEINSVQAQSLGEMILLHENQTLTGFAICHIGPETEAGTDKLYVKFAALKPATNGPKSMAKLLQSIESLAAEKAVKTIEIGTNLGRCESYEVLISAGYHILQQGVAMHHENHPGYNRPGVFVFDDWR